MQRIIFLAAILFLMNGLSAQKTIIHDANTEVRNIGDFSAISISGGIDLYLSQDAELGMAVSASETSFRDRIKTVVENGVLKIWFDAKGWRFNSGNKKLVAYVSFRALERLTASGASDVYLDGILKGEQLTMKLSGASDFKGTVALNKLVIDQSGASDATISGKATIMDVETSGASDLKGYNLETENCTARASGASDIKITVNKELTATASGASSIAYKGSGSITKIHTSGASSVNKRG